MGAGRWVRGGHQRGEDDVQLSIQTNFPEVQRKLDLLHKEVADKAAARALNRAIEQARTQMGREIRAEFMVDARYVRERLRIKRATFRAGVLGLSATLDGSSGKRSANLVRFGARQVGTGVSVKIKRNGGRKVAAGAFIANKGRTVFKRVPGTVMNARRGSRGLQHRERIEPVQTVDVPQMFNTRRIKAAVTAAVQQRFPAIFARELAFALQQFNR